MCVCVCAVHGVAQTFLSKCSVVSHDTMTSAWRNDGTGGTVLAYACRAHVILLNLDLSDEPEGTTRRPKYGRCCATCTQTTGIARSVVRSDDTEKGEENDCPVCVPERAKSTSLLNEVTQSRARAFTHFLP